MDEQANGGEIPLVEVVSASGDSASLDERKQLEHDGKRLDHGLRKWAARGALLMALLLYLGGLAAIVLFLGLCPHYPAVSPEMWHIVAVTLIALFTVPTILLLAVLRSTNAVTQSEISTPAEWVGEKVVALLEKFTGESK